MAVKDEFKQILERRKLQNLDQYLERSLNTIYSKMLAQKYEIPDFGTAFFNQILILKENNHFVTNLHKETETPTGRLQ